MCIGSSSVIWANGSWRSAKEFIYIANRKLGLGKNFGSKLHCRKIKLKTLTAKTLLQSEKPAPCSFNGKNINVKYTRSAQNARKKIKMQKKKGRH
jgi:hypothetical protein